MGTPPRGQPGLTAYSTQLSVYVPARALMGFEADTSKRPKPYGSVLRDIQYLLLDN